MRGASRGDPEVEQRAVRRRRCGVLAVRAGPGLAGPAARRPRAGFAGRLSGGPGQPSGPTTRVCLQWLDGAGRRAAKAARTGGLGPLSPQRKNGPWNRNRRKWSAGWRARRSQGARTPRGVELKTAPAGAPSPRIFWRGTTPPHPLREGHQTTANPAPQRTGAMTLALAHTGQARHARRCSSLPVIPAKAGIQ